MQDGFKGDQFKHQGYRDASVIFDNLACGNRSSRNEAKESKTWPKIHPFL